MTRGRIQAEVDRMTDGQRLDVDWFEFSREFAYGWPSIYETPIQSFLSKQMGSAWGNITADMHPSGKYVTIAKHAERPNPKRVYVDPDRGHMFDRSPDGELVLKPHYRS